MQTVSHGRCMTLRFLCAGQKALRRSPAIASSFATRRRTAAVSRPPHRVNDAVIHVGRTGIRCVSFRCLVLPSPSERTILPATKLKSIIKTLYRPRRGPYNTPAPLSSSARRLTLNPLKSGHIRLETPPYANTEYLITVVTAAVKLYNRFAATNINLCIPQPHGGFQPL